MLVNLRGNIATASARVAKGERSIVFVAHARVCICVYIYIYVCVRFHVYVYNCIYEYMRTHTQNHTLWNTPKGEHEMR